MRILLPMLLVALLIAFIPPVARSSGEGWLIASRRVNGQADLWAMPASGGPWQQLTATPDDERWPVWSPNGEMLAYAARRDRNWDLYTMDLRSGRERRLTTNAHFEGWPAWSPDGTRIAYASAREGDLDLFLLDLESGDETNLTLSSPAMDFEPRWEDDDQLIFVSTRDGSHDIFRIDLTTNRVTPLATTREKNERQPMLVSGRATDEQLLVLVEEEHSRSLQWLNPTSRQHLELVRAGRLISAAISPEGSEVFWLERRLAGDMLYSGSLTDGTSARMSGPTMNLNDLSWGYVDDTLLKRQLEVPTAEPVRQPPEPEPREVVWIDDLDTQQPRLSEAALPAFQAARARVAAELNRDFLGAVSEVLRPIDFDSEESDYLSWHKAGRAMDTLFDLGWRGGRQMLELVREDQHGDVYWRMWLRCPVQDGTCGEPLVDAPWDLSYAARWEVAPGEGGVPKLFQSGYYVDFTRIAEDHGWDRIGSYEIPDFDWRSNTVALEYWHYQLTGDLSWYDAMLELYSPELFNDFFGWAELTERNLPRWQIVAKGIPLPPELRHTPAEIVIP